MIDQELTTELQAILKADYGWELNNQEALEVGEQLLASYEILIKLKFENNSQL